MAEGLTGVRSGDVLVVLLLVALGVWVVPLPERALIGSAACIGPLLERDHEADEEHNS